MFALHTHPMAPYFQTLYQFGWHAWSESRADVADWYTRIRALASYP